MNSTIRILNLIAAYSASLFTTALNSSANTLNLDEIFKYRYILYLADTLILNS